MMDTLNEQLSALVDDELGEPEQDLLLRRLVGDAGLRDRLVRYQLISDALRSDLPHRVDIGFHRRVHAALAQEAAIHAAPALRIKTLFKPLAGLAVAASVAVVAVLSLQSVRRPDTAVPVIASVPGVNDYIRADNTPAPVVQHNNARGLDVYLVNHNEYAVNRGMQGMLPYVRIVGQDLQPDGNEDAR